MPATYSDRDALLAQITDSPWESDPHLRLADLEREAGDEAEGDLRERMGRWVERRMVTPWREPGLWTAPNDRTYLEASSPHQMLDPYRHPMVSATGSTWVVDPGPRGRPGDPIWAWLLGGPSQGQDLPPELLAGAPSVLGWYMARESGTAPGTANISDNVYPLMPRSEGVYADVLSPSERLAAGVDDLRGAPASLWSEVERILRQQAARGQRFSNPAGPTNYAEPAWPDARMRIPVWSFISGSNDLDLFHVVPAARPDGSWAWQPDVAHARRLTLDSPDSDFFAHLPPLKGFVPDRYHTDPVMARAWDNHRDAHRFDNWDGRVLYPQELWMATGGQAGEPPPEIDWRQTETIPEDFYTMERGGAPTGYVDPRLAPTSPHSPAYRQAHGMPRAGQYPVPPYEVVSDEELEQQKQTVKQKSQDIPGPPSGFVEVPPPGEYPTGSVGPFGDSDDPYWGDQNPEEMGHARADHPVDWDDAEFSLVDPRHRVEEIPEPEPEEIPEEGGWDDAEFAKRLVNRGIPESGPFAQEAARRLKAATALQRPPQVRPPHWTDQGGYHPSWAPGGPRAPRGQPSADPWAWIKNLFRRGNYTRYDRDGSAPTNYSDEATVRALLQQLAAAEQAAHRWGRDDAVNGLRGIVADVLDDYATNTGNPQFAREAALLRSGRHVVVTPDGVRPGRWAPDRVQGAWDSLIGHALDLGFPVPEFTLFDETERESLREIAGDDYDPEAFDVPVPPGHLRATNFYPPRDTRPFFWPAEMSVSLPVDRMPEVLSDLWERHWALVGEAWAEEGVDGDTLRRFASELRNAPVEEEDPDAEYARRAPDRVNYAEPDRRRFSRVDPHSVSGFGPGRDFVRVWVPGRTYRGYYWKADGVEPHDPKVHGLFESLPSDEDLYNEEYLTPHWLWAMGLPGGEPPPAPEQDWRPSESTPEDFYARSRQGTTYADPSKFRLPVWEAHGYANALTHVQPLWSPDWGWYWYQERGPMGLTTEFDTDPTWWSDRAEHVGVPFDLERFHNDPAYLRELQDAVDKFRTFDYAFRKLTPQELWMASQGEFGQAPGGLTDELHEDAQGNQTGAFPEDFYAMSRGGRQTNYGLAEDLQGFTREVHQNPLELTGHLGLADFLDDNDMSRDAAFRRALADVIRTRLDTPWVDKTRATARGYPLDPSVRGFSRSNIPWTRVWTREPANGLWAAGWSDHELRPHWDRDPMGPDSDPAWRWIHWGSSRREGDPVSAGENPAAEWVPWLEGRLGGPWAGDWEGRDAATALTPGELGAFDFTNLPDVDPQHWPAVEAALRQNWDRFEQFADDLAPTRYAGDRPWSRSNHGGFSDEPPENSMWSFMSSSGMPATWPPEWRGRNRWDTKIATQMVPSTGGRAYDPEDPNSHPSWVYTNRGVGRVVPDQIADWMMMPQIETWGRDLNADRDYFHIVTPWRDDFDLDRLLFKPLSPQDMFRTGYWDSPFRGVLNDPDDFVGRLAFADWLEEERPDLSDEYGGWPKHEREAAERVRRRFETRGPWHLLRPIPDGYIPETIRLPDPDPDSFDHNARGRKGLGSRRPYARTDYAALEPTPEPRFNFSGFLMDQHEPFKRLFWRLFEAPAVPGWGGPSWMARPYVIFRDPRGVLRWTAEDIPQPLRDNSEQTVADFLAARRGELWPFALPQDDIFGLPVSPSDLWALGLPGGEPPPAPETDWRTQEAVPEDYYSAQRAATDYADFPTRMVADSPALPRLRKRRKSGDYRVLFEGQEEPTEYGPHVDLNTHLRGYDPAFDAGGTVDEARRAEAVYKLRTYADLFRDEGREAHAEMIERNIAGYGDIGIWGLGLPPGFEEGQGVLRINPHGYDPWGNITPPHEYVIGMNVHAGVRPYEFWRPDSGRPLEEYPYYRGFHSLITDPEEAMDLIERLMGEGGRFPDDLEDWEAGPYGGRVRPGVRNNWAYHLLREHAKRSPLHPNLRKYLTRSYAAGDEGARTDYSLPEQRAWLERIAQNWTDSNEHAVYADWLDEMGDPREASFRRALAAWLQGGPVGRTSAGRPTVSRSAAPDWSGFDTMPDQVTAIMRMLDGYPPEPFEDERSIPDTHVPPHFRDWRTEQGLENDLRDRFAQANPTGYDCGEYGGTMKPVLRERFLRAFN